MKKHFTLLLWMSSILVANACQPFSAKAAQTDCSDPTHNNPSTLTVAQPPLQWAAQDLSACELEEIEGAILNYYQEKPGYAILQHKVTPLEKKVTEQLIYYYGYYEVSGTYKGKPLPITKKIYLIAWKKLSNNTWKQSVDVWDYSTATVKQPDHLYFF